MLRAVAQKTAMPWSPRWSVIPHRISVAVRQQRHLVQTMSSSRLGFRQEEATDAKKWECVSLSIVVVLGSLSCPSVFHVWKSKRRLEVRGVTVRGRRL